MLQPSNATARVVGDLDVAQEREGAVLQLERGALGAAQALGDLEQPQPHRPIGAEHLAGGDAEEERVADLAARSGDRDSRRGRSPCAERYVPSIQPT